MSTKQYDMGHSSHWFTQKALWPLEGSTNIGGIQQSCLWLILMKQSVQVCYFITWSTICLLCRRNQWENRLQRQLAFRRPDETQLTGLFEAGGSVIFLEVYRSISSNGSLGKSSNYLKLLRQIAWFIIIQVDCGLTFCMIAESLKFILS